jgi:hypothetical protein
MDPITLILTALTVGAGASVKDVANQAIKDAYNRLKILIENKLVDNRDAEVA